MGLGRASVTAWFAARRRAFLGALGVLLLAAAVAWSAAHWIADAELAAFEARWAEEVAAARERAAQVRVPAVRGEAVDANAAEGYRAISWRLEARLTLGKVPRDPAAPVSTRMAAQVRRWADEIAALRSATRAGRCDWATPYEEPMVARPDCLGALNVARLSIVDGHLRARSGDAAGAAAAYLDAARFGADWERGWTGPRDVLPLALEALARLVASERGRSCGLAEVEEGLDRLERGLVPLRERLEEQRLDLLGRLARATLVEGGLARELSLHPRSWLPEQLLGVHALVVLDPAWREAERAAARGDVEAWEQLDRAIRARCRPGGPTVEMPSWNPLVLELYPTPAGWVDHRRVVLAWLAFVRAAVALERLPAPRDVAGLRLPPDPFHPDRPIGLTLDPDGVGYTLSVTGPPRLHRGRARAIQVALQRAR